jgi:carboxypeptidase C (cathepsin A)
MKSAGYLELRTVNNAGHLVPLDQGEASLNMVT